MILLKFQLCLYKIQINQITTVFYMLQIKLLLIPASIEISFSFAGMKELPSFPLLSGRLASS